MSRGFWLTDLGNCHERHCWAYGYVSGGRGRGRSLIGFFISTPLFLISTFSCPSDRILVQLTVFKYFLPVILLVLLFIAIALFLDSSGSVSLHIVFTSSPYH